MSKHIEFTHQAFAAYSSRNFEQALALLCKGLDHWESPAHRLSNASYNAIYDALEMIEALLVYVTVWESNDYVVQLLQTIRKSLDDVKEVVWDDFQQHIEEFKVLLQGVRIGFNFFNNNNLALLDANPILSFALTEEGTITLLKSRGNAKVDALVEAFNACFRAELTSLEQCEKEIKAALDLGDVSRAKYLLEWMMEQYPESKKQAFLQLGHLYFEEESYQKAAESYMKTIVMGTPKEFVRDNVQVACNRLAADASNSKEANRWREVLINFF